MPTDAEALGADDLQILELETGNVVGHTCKLIVLGPRSDGSAVTLADVRHHVSSRISRVPSLTRRLGTDSAGQPAWVGDLPFDADAHVLPWAADPPVDDEAVRTAAAGLMARHLPRERPLWQLHVLEHLTRDRTALVWRVHHALADGFTSMQLAAALFWDEQERERAPADGAGAVARRGVEVTRPSPSRWTRARATARLYSRLPGTVARELIPRYASSALDAEVGRERRLALAAVGLSELRQLGKAHGTAITLNDTLLAVIAGAIRIWLQRRGDALRAIRVKVPVSLHSSADDPGKAGNRDSFFFVALPVSEPDPVKRLLAISRSTATRKGHHDAETIYTMPFTHAASRWARSSHVFTFNVSNIRGPEPPVSVAGAPVVRLYTIAEIAEHHALRIAAMSGAGQLTISACADAAAVPDVGQLERALYASIDELRVRAGVGR